MRRYVDIPARGLVKRALRKVLPSYRASSMGGPHVPPLPANFIPQEIADYGERVIPEQDDYCYYAHLSIYNFAKPYSFGRRVLDAGCGTGYGSHYLYKNGGATSVLGIDISEKAISYCRARYEQPNLHYEVMNLEDLKIPRSERFGLIFSSNVLEHVADADAFLEKATHLMTDDGVFVLAVPPINSIEALQGNLENPYHINNLTPPAWIAKMRRFFESAQGYRHWLEPEWLTPANEQAFRNDMREHHFTFTERSDAEMMTEIKTMTTIVVARKPRSKPLPKSPDEMAYPAEWNVEWDYAKNTLRRAGKSEGTLGAIYGDRVLEQGFTCLVENLSEIQAFLATYARVNDSTLTMTLHRDTADGPVVARVDADAREIRDNEWHRFPFAPIAGSKDQRYVLTLSSRDARPDNSVTAYYTSDELPGRDSVRVGKVERAGNILQFHTRWSE